MNWIWLAVAFVLGSWAGTGVTLVVVALCGTARQESA